MPRSNLAGEQSANAKHVWAKPHSRRNRKMYSTDHDGSFSDRNEVESLDNEPPPFLNKPTWFIFPLSFLLPCK